MKIYYTSELLLLALCVLSSSVGMSSAFSIQPPKALSFKTSRVSSSSLASSGGGGLPPGGPPPGGDPSMDSTASALSQASAAAAASRDIGPAGGVGGAMAPPPPGPAGAMTQMRLDRGVWDNLTPTLVQGGSLRTWSFYTPNVECVQVLLKTEGRPLNANVDLWQGPDNTPQKMGVYIEDGSERPFCAVIATPRGHNAIAIRNTGQMEFPMAACVEAGTEIGGIDAVTQALKGMTGSEIIQGGAIKTYAFAPSVESVQVLLETDGRPLNARIELLQGPNNNKQVLELYTEDGMERPFFAVIESPGVGNVVRVINTAPMEFPLMARVEPYMVNPDIDDNAPIMGGGGGGIRM